MRFMVMVRADKDRRLSEPDRASAGAGHRLIESRMMHIPV